MNLSPTAQATLLLTSHFSPAGREQVQPLTNSEWGRFALWLKEQSTTPADLLFSDPSALLARWQDNRISAERIRQLLSRGHSLALAVEKWQRAGLWIITRSDPEYPGHLKQRLRTDSPPVLFGCGNQALLNTGGLAVIGSRNASAADLSFARQIGEIAAAENTAIVSGGARGIDESAMTGAMQQGGVVAGVLADSLLKAATHLKWRKGVMNGNLVLVSPFYPEAEFSAGNAMARNKYIYCLADSALVVHAGKTGGTLNGAEENLKKGWVPLWVKPTEDKNAASADLVARGGRWCESAIQHLSLSSLFESAPGPQEQQPDLFSMREEPTSFAAQACAQTPSRLSEQQSPVDFYQLFIAELHRLAVAPTTVDQLAEQTALHKTQLNHWLKRAVDDGVIRKLRQPVRYQLTEKP